MALNSQSPFFSPRWVRPLLWAGIFIAIVVLSLLWGRYPRVGFNNIADFKTDSLAWALLLNIRLPRMVMALVLGAVLGAAGTVLQTVLGNPLVEPGLLGVSQGSAFGAALAILFGSRFVWAIPYSAAVFGLGGLFLSFFLARRIQYGGSILRLVLAGVVVSALFSSGLGMLKYLADPMSELPEITFWMMGGLSSVDWETIARTLPPVLLSMGILLAVRWRINLLVLDDRSTFSLGGRPSRDRLSLVVLAVIAVAAVTSAAGIVSWVGLLVPHIARKIGGADTSRCLPWSMVLGGLFVLICDDIARGLLLGEIPLGLLTAFGGALAFALLMTHKTQGRR